MQMPCPGPARACTVRLDRSASAMAGGRPTPGCGRTRSYRGAFGAFAVDGVRGGQAPCDVPGLPRTSLQSGPWTLRMTALPCAVRHADARPMRAPSVSQFAPSHRTLERPRAAHQDIHGAASTSTIRPIRSAVGESRATGTVARPSGAIHSSAIQSRYARPCVCWKWVGYANDVWCRQHDRLRGSQRPRWLPVLSTEPQRYMMCTTGSVVNAASARLSCTVHAPRVDPCPVPRARITNRPRAGMQ
ncbi:hypothetical protein C8Q77DRAFT_764824 [Trametes polyzona]|nr:hypothetical protein C8Q77DRAFT_764506 [Trametes polyzona]KAI0634562.1 hypothetical protein C8Q77DRAFT_764824 [Trametes polyzona]